MNENPYLEITVEDEPRAWGNDEDDWRRRILKECEKKEKITEKINLKVEIIFYLKKDRLERNDLDNLAKPVLDTICKIRYAKKKKLIGAIFDYDDDKVFQLILEKKPTKDKEKAIIKIWKINNRNHLMEVV